MRFMDFFSSKLESRLTQSALATSPQLPHTLRVIQLSQVSKSFGKQKVLKDFSFHLEKGQTLALLGLSGSGKTTALKLISGLQYADEGSIVVAGIPVSRPTIKQIRQKLGYVIQDGGLFPHLTARENIELVGKEAKLSADVLRSRIAELAAMTKIDLSLLERYPRELSGGQRQRIGIIRTLLLEPEILLLDEPMGALDPITRKQLQIEMRELFRRLGKTVVLVTHDLFEATILADRIILLEDGRIVQEGSLAELIEAPATDFVRAFVGAQRHDLGVQ